MPPSRALHPELISPSWNRVHGAAGVASGHPVTGQGSRFSVWVHLPARPSPAPGSLLYLLPRTCLPGEESKAASARAAWLPQPPECQGCSQCCSGNRSKTSRHTHKAGAEQPGMRPVSCLSVGGREVMHLHKEILRRDSRMDLRGFLGALEPGWARRGVKDGRCVHWASSLSTLTSVHVFSVINPYRSDPRGG